MYTLYQPKMSYFVKQENTAEVLHQRQQQIIQQQQKISQKQQLTIQKNNKIMKLFDDLLLNFQVLSERLGAIENHSKKQDAQITELYNQDDALNANLATFHHQLDAVVAMTHDPDTTLWPNDHEH